MAHGFRPHPWPCSCRPWVRRCCRVVYLAAFTGSPIRCHGAILALPAAPLGSLSRRVPSVAPSAMADCTGSQRRRNLAKTTCMGFASVGRKASAPAPGASLSLSLVEYCQRPSVSTRYSPASSPATARNRLILPIIGNSLHIVVCKCRRLFLLGFFGAAFR